MAILTSSPTANKLVLVRFALPPLATLRQSHRESRERTDLTRRYGMAKHCEPGKIGGQFLFAFGRWHAIPLAERTAASKVCRPLEKLRLR